ncbi:unnamed protein product, partial [Closterium sp. NIES-53]
MFKGLRSRTKEKFEFRLRFHATRLPPLGHESLHVSLYQDTGRLQSQTSRVAVKNGACQWADTLTEVVKLTRAKGSKAFDAKHYRLVVASGPSKASILGEASLNLADFAAFSQLDQRSLPLRCCEAGSVLHVTVHSIPLETRHTPNSHSDDESESVDGAPPRSPHSLSFTRHRPYDTESDDERGDERESGGAADEESEAEERMYAAAGAGCARSRSARYSSSAASEPADSLPATPVTKPAVASAAPLAKLQLFTGSARSLTAPSTPPRSLNSPRTPPTLAQVSSGPSAPDFSLSPPPALRAHHLPPRKDESDYARNSDREFSDAPSALPPPAGAMRSLSSPRASPLHSSASDVSPPLDPPPFLHPTRASSRPSSPMRAAGNARMSGAGGLGWRGEGAGVGGIAESVGGGSVSVSSSAGGWSIARGSSTSASISRSSSCASSHGGWSAIGSFRGAQSPVSRRTLLLDLQQQQQQAGGMGSEVKTALAQAERKVGASGTDATRATSCAGAGGAGQGAGMRNGGDGMSLNARVSGYSQAESVGRSAGSSVTHGGEADELRGAEARARISRSRSVSGGGEGGNDALVAAEGAAARDAEESRVPGWQVERLRAQVARARAQQTKVEEERDRLAEELRRAQSAGESAGAGSGGAGTGTLGALGATTSSSSNGSGSGLWGSGWEASGGEGSGGEGTQSSTDGGESSGREAMEEASRLRGEVSRAREEVRYYKDVSARLTAQVDLLRTTNDSLAQEARQAAEDANKARREAQELAATGRERERALRRMDGAAEEKERAWRDRLQRLVEERGDLEAKLRRAEAEREEAEEQLRAHSDFRRGGNGESAGAGSAEELRELRARVEEGEREVEELTQESLQLAAGLSAARRDVAEREARIKELQVQVSVLQRWERREERRGKGGDDWGMRRREEGGVDESGEGAEQLEQLQQQLRRQEEQAQEAEAQARRLEEQCAELEEAAQRGRERAEEAEKRAEQLAQQLADAERAAREAEEAQRRAEGQARLAEMSAERLGNRVRALTPLEARVGELEEELRVGMERVRVQERVKAEAEARARQQAALLAEVREELEGEVRRLGNQVEGLQQRCRAVQGEKESLEAERDRLEGEVKQARAAALAQAGKAEAEAKRAWGEVESMRRAVESLERGKREAEEEAKGARDARRAADVRVEELSVQLASLREVLQEQAERAESAEAGRKAQQAQAEAETERGKAERLQQE